MPQPYIGDVVYCSFLDRGNIIFAYCSNDQEEAIHLRVVTLRDTASDAPLRVYDFALDPCVLKVSPTEMRYLFANTLPSNTSSTSSPGLFHTDPRSRLLGLMVNKRTNHHILYIPHDTFLSYVATHPSDTDTVIVPWPAWGPGNTHLIIIPHASLNTYFYFGICGMHVLAKTPVIQTTGDREILRIMDYHPGRIARNLATQDLHLPGTAGNIIIMQERPSAFDITAEQESKISSSPDTEILCTPKDIPLPDGLLSRSTQCILGEDVVVLFEVGTVPKSAA